MHWVPQEIPKFVDDSAWREAQLSKIFFKVDGKIATLPSSHTGNLFVMTSLNHADSIKLDIKSTWVLNDHVLL